MHTPPPQRAKHAPEMRDFRAPRVTTPPPEFLVSTGKRSSRYCLRTDSSPQRRSLSMLKRTGQLTAMKAAAKAFTKRQAADAAAHGPVDLAAAARQARRFLPATSADLQDLKSSFGQ